MPRTCESVIESELAKPSGFKEFLVPITLQLNQDPWWNLAVAYEIAFYDLASSALGKSRRIQELSMPLAFLCRHSIELFLKAVIDIIDNGLVDDIDIGRHGLIPLWHQLLSLLDAEEIIVDREWASECERLVVHIHNIDPLGQAFRYPADKRGKAWSFGIDLEALVKAHWKISRFCNWARLAPWERRNELYG